MSRQDEIRARASARVSSSVGKTTGVIVGHDPGTKAQKAASLGVPVLDEAAFRALIMN
jgi:DNA ligase (NAD+)